MAGPWYPASPGGQGGKKWNADGVVDSGPNSPRIDAGGESDADASGYVVNPPPPPSVDADGGSDASATGYPTPPANPRAGAVEARVLHRSVPRPPRVGAVEARVLHKVLDIKPRAGAVEARVLHAQAPTKVRAGSVDPRVLRQPPPVPSETQPSREGGRRRRGLGRVDWAPPVARPVNLAQAYDTNQQYPAPAIVHGTMPLIQATRRTERRPRLRVVVGGQDVSFFRGVPVPEPDYQLQEPLLYGPTAISFQAINPAFETPGVGALSWLYKGAEVLLQRVDDAAGTVVATDYKGVVVSFDTEGKGLTVGVGGEATGRAALRERPVPLFVRRNDLGFWWWGALKDLNLTLLPRLGPTTGIDLRNAGGMSYLEYMDQLSSKGQTRAGELWTCMPGADGAYRLAFKDTTTVHGTVYADDADTVASLVSDASEEPNEVYATGIAPSGMRVKFGAYPGLKPDKAPPYPYADKRSFGPGTTDGMTDTGDGVTLMVWRLQKMGFLSFADFPGGYDSDAAAAVRALKRQAGLEPLFTSEGPQFYQAAYKHNRPFAVAPADPDYPYQTGLTNAQGANFEAWVNTYGVPFDLDAHVVDYDMRGYWKNESPGPYVPGQHFPDTYKTPYDTTFSEESQYATGNCPFKWRGDVLVDTRNGTVVFAPAGTLGWMTPQAWRALFDLSSTGYSIAGSKILPAARDPRTDPWVRSASGGVIASNPLYDPARLVVSRSIDMGVDLKRSQMRRFAQHIVDENATDQWSGTIEFKTGALVRGQHVPGTALTHANFMSAREVKPGMNLWMPHFMGGTLFHVSAVSLASGVVTATVDTRARDAMEVWEVIARNKESRRDPSRSWIRAHRSSALTKDAIMEFDEVGGTLEDGLDLDRNAWNVFPIVAGQEGTIARLHLETTPKAEFAVAVFGDKIGPGRLRTLVGNPLRKEAHDKWTDEAVRQALADDYYLLYVAGSYDNPCGYYPKDKVSDADEDKNPPPLTGKWQDDAGFGYRALLGSVLWVAVWPDRDTRLRRGRIMWPQLEAGS